jgi:hypothetical protein
LPEFRLCPSFAFARVSVDSHHNAGSRFKNDAGRADIAKVMSEHTAPVEVPQAAGRPGQSIGDSVKPVSDTPEARMWRTAVQSGSTSQHARIAGLDTSGWALVGILGTLFALALQPAVDPDLGWHLGTGRWIVENGRIPFTDPFSWSVPGRKWIAHEWLTEVVMFGVRSIGGDTLLIVLWAALITGAWAMLHRTCRLLGATRSWAAWVTALGAISTVHTWGVRPQMLTLALTTYVGMRLQRWARPSDRHGRAPWELIPLVALWVNLHGGYIFGIVMVLVFACGTTGERIIPRLGPSDATPPTNRALMSIWALTIGCVLASLCSPNTIDGLIYPFTYLGDNASTRYVGEWFRPDYSNAQFWPFALLLMLGLPTVLVGLRRRSIGLTEVGLVVPFAVLGAQSMRNISQYAVCAVPVVAAVATELTSKRRIRRLTRPPRRDAVDQRLKTVMVACVVTVTVISSVAISRSTISPAGNADARASEYPLDAARWLADNPGGRVFNHYNYGGWLILEGVPVFVDGRPDMYGDAFMDEYVRISGAAGSRRWQVELERLRADRVLMPKDSPLARQMATDIAAGRATGWSEPTTDPVARLFVRTP